MRRILGRTGNLVVLPFEVLSAVVTAGLVYVLVSRPRLRRRQLSRIILAQAVADCIYASGNVAFILKTDCGPLLNRYGFISVTFSSAWVAVLAFHLAAQASGKWIEVERWGIRYHLFAFGVTAVLSLVSFGLEDFDVGVCFTDYPSGVRLNDRLAIGLVFGTTAWCVGCLAYTRWYLQVQLYSARFVAIYIVCWVPQLVWFGCELAGVAKETLESQVWMVTICVMLSLLGIANAVTYSTMPPEFVLRRYLHEVRTGRGLKMVTTCCGLFRSSPPDSGDDDPLLRVGVVSPDGSNSPTTSVQVDAAADTILTSMLAQYGSAYGDFFLLPSTLTLGDELGAGAFGIVYKGSYQTVDVAIKELRTGLRQDSPAEALDSFKGLLDEASMLARARHRHLVNFIGISLSVQGRLLVVMELCQCTVRTYLSERRATDAPPDAMVATQLRVCTELCMALAFLHTELNVVHRDVKLENIFVTAKGQVKLGDLGSACLVQHLAEAADAGTPVYLAPEGFRGGPGWGNVKWADRLDIFAAAITICEIFTDRLPYAPFIFHIHSSHELYDAVAEGLRPSTLGCPETISAICQRCWTFQPALRMSSTELVRRLKATKVSHKHDKSRASSPPLNQSERDRLVYE
eukprot:m.76244 g.76244  ORF g.76244 m.76244 type:complete len:630 (-) comp19014_c0_seq1:26-1915(-)